MAPESLGEFEQLVLLAVPQLSDGSYPSAVAREIEARTGRSVLRGAVYVTLDRLEGKGFLHSSLGAPTPQRGGRPKRFYGISPAGVKALRQAIRAVDRMAAGLDLILGRT